MNSISDRPLDIIKRATGMVVRPLRVVREGGLEPPHPFGYRHLKPARLPIPPLARGYTAS